MPEQPMRRPVREAAPPITRPTPLPLSNPLGPTPSDPLGVAAAAAKASAAARQAPGTRLAAVCPHCEGSVPYKLEDGGQPATCPACGKGLTLPPIDKLDFVIAELRELRSALAPPLVSIRSMLTWMFIGGLVWVALVGGCQKMIDFHQQDELRRSLDRY